MRVLAIDTALGACSSAVYSTDTQSIEAYDSQLMDRGHAEALLPQVDRVMNAAGREFQDLDRIAVTIGPGSYTGLRVGIAAARAFGLAAGCPVVGVSTLSAMLAPLIAGDNRTLLATAIDAKHGHVYFQAVAPGGRLIVSPSLMSIRDAVRMIGAGPAVLSGSGGAAVAAECLIQGIDAVLADAPVAPDIVWVAKLAAAADPSQALPKPLYLKGPDAKPQDHARLPRR